MRRALRDQLRLGADRRGPSGPGRRLPRHRRHGAAERPPPRRGAEPAPLLALRRHRGAPRGHKPARDPLRLPAAHRPREPVAAGHPARDRQRSALQRDPQDGLQLRLGLGPGAGHQRDRRADRARGVVRGTAGGGAPARHRRGRARRGGRAGPARARRPAGRLRARPHRPPARPRRTARGRGRGELRRGPARPPPARGGSAAVVAPRLRRPAPVHRRDHAARRGRRRTRSARAPHRPPHRRSGGGARRDLHLLHDRGQRPPDPRQGRQLDPRRLLPLPPERRGLPRLDHRRPRRGHEHPADLGRRAVRVRAPLRAVRRAGDHGVAGLRLRLRRLLRARAAAQRGRGRGA